MYGLRVIMQMRKNPSYRYSKLYSRYFVQQL